MESHTILQTTNTNIELTHDLIFEILSWMPTKSVCRFKSCSKFINEITNDSYFTVKHSQNNLILRDDDDEDEDSCFFIQNKVFGIHDCKTEIHALKSPGDHQSSSSSSSSSSCGFPSKFLYFLDKKSATIRASSNGLLLCMTTREINPIQLFICNPITQSCSFIPMPYDFPENYEVLTAFAFELCDIADDAADDQDFKLLAFQYTLGSSATPGCKIFLPKQGVWESKQGFSIGHSPIRSDLPVLYNGDFHFLSQWNPNFYDPCIVSYNLESDTTRRLNLPEEALECVVGERFHQEGIFKWGKISSNSCICLVKLVNGVVFTIWVLTDYEASGWSRFLSISLEEMGLICNNGEKKGEICNGMFLVINGKCLVFGTSSGNVYRCDLLSGERKARVEKVAACDHGCICLPILTSYCKTLRSYGPASLYH